jgi:predicted acylesterase/phospholipase RssA
MGCQHVIGVNTLGQMTGGRLRRRLPWQAYDVWDRYVRMAAHEIGRVHGEVAADVVIAPRVGDTTMLGFSRAGELIDAGRRAAEEQLPRIREALLARTTPVDGRTGATTA